MRVTVRALRGRRARSGVFVTLTDRNLLDRLESWLAVECRHTIEPGGELRRVGLQPFLGCLRTLIAVGENLVHDKVLDIDREDKIFDELGRIRALLGPASALVGVDDRAAKIRAKLSSPPVRYWILKLTFIG